MFLYKLTHEKVSRDDNIIQLPIGHYGIRHIDNLLILQNNSFQETYILDIKSCKYPNKAFFKF